MTYFRSLGPQSISTENNTSRVTENVLEQRETTQTQGQLWPGHDLESKKKKNIVRNLQNCFFHGKIKIQNQDRYDRYTS